jgi:Ca2+-binding RTX toxin-like protein
VHIAGWRDKFYIPLVILLYIYVRGPTLKNKAVLFIAVILLLTFTLVGARADKEQTETSKNKVVTGTDGDDTINTGNLNNNINSGAGNDTITSGAGNDLVNGGKGDDKINDGAGDDYVIGGDGDDTVLLGPGDDYVNLGPGNDTLVINMAEDIGKLNYADGGEGEDTVVFVIDDPNELLKGDILKYYENEKLLGKKIVDMGKFNVGAGLSNFEQVGFAASYTF